MKNKVVIIVHNIRSSHNVGSILRSADGFGIDAVFLTGYTPHPEVKDDIRPPYERSKVENQIQKTSLGAEKSVKWEYEQDLEKVVERLKKKRYQIAALEQTKSAQNLNRSMVGDKIAVIVGNEVNGLDEKSLSMADIHFEIPMQGAKESFNVSVAAAIAMYHFTEAQA